MQKLVIKSEKKAWMQKKPCVGLSEETGKSMTELANTILEFGFENLYVEE